MLFFKDARKVKKKKKKKKKIETSHPPQFSQNVDVNLKQIFGVALANMGVATIYAKTHLRTLLNQIWDYYFQF